MQALLQPSQLPAGEWTTADPPPCPWALSADELLAAPECRSAAAAADAAANDEARNGNAHVTFAGPDDVEIDDRVEIYTSAQNVDAIRAILVSPSMPECYSAALPAPGVHRAGHDRPQRRASNTSPWSPTPPRSASASPRPRATRPIRVSPTAWT